MFSYPRNPSGDGRPPLNPPVSFLRKKLLHFPSKSRDVLDISSLKHALVSHMRHFSSILTPTSNRGAKSQRNDSLRGLSVINWYFGSVFANSSLGKLGISRPKNAGHLRHFVNANLGGRLFLQQNGI